MTDEGKLVVFVQAVLAFVEVWKCNPIIISPITIMVNLYITDRISTVQYFSRFAYSDHERILYYIQ